MKGKRVYLGLQLLLCLLGNSWWLVKETNWTKKLLFPYLFPFSIWRCLQLTWKVNHLGKTFLLSSKGLRCFFTIFLVLPIVILFSLRKFWLCFNALTLESIRFSVLRKGTIIFKKITLNVFNTRRHSLQQTKYRTYLDHFIKIPLLQKLSISRTMY